MILLTKEIERLEQSTHRLRVRIGEYELSKSAEFISAAQLYRKELEKEELHLKALKFYKDNGGLPS